MAARVLKWAVRACLILVLLIAVMAGVTGFLAGTPEGLNLLLDKAGEVIPGKVSVGEIQGGLLGRLCLKGVSYRQSAFEVGIEEFSLVWQPSELLHGTFHVSLIKASGVRFVQNEKHEEEQKEEPSGPLNLPDIALPVAVVLDNVEVRSIRVAGEEDGGKPLEISRVALAAVIDDSGLDLSRFEFLMPGFSLELGGTLVPRGVYPLDFRMKWKAALHDPDVEVKGRGVLAGDTNALMLEQALEGDVGAKLVASATDVLGQLDWNAKFGLSHVSNRLYKYIGAISGDEGLETGAEVLAKGNLEQVEASARIRLLPVLQKTNGKDGNSTVLKKAPAFRMEEETRGEQSFRKVSPGTLVLAANATLIISSMNFDVSGRWQDLHWPLSGIPSYVSEAGNFTVSGTPEEYSYSFSAGVNGTEIPAVRLDVQGTGKPDSTDIETAEARLLGGRVRLKGTAGWKPSVWWKAEAVGNGLDPSRKYPQWPGSLGFELNSHGKLEGNTTDIQLDISSLEGTLRKRKVRGSGRVAFAGGEIDIKALKLGCGNAKVDIQGLAGKKWDLSWNVLVPDMLDLLPESHGSLESTGRLFGKGSVPSAKGSLDVLNFWFSDLQCQRLSADFSLSTDESRPLSVALDAAGLAARGQEIPRLSLNVRGTLSRHRLVAKAVHSEGILSLEAGRAGFDLKGRRWTGFLEKMSLETQEFGKWHLESPVKMDLSARDIDIPRLCLKDSEASLCIQGHWMKKGDGSAVASLKNLSLERFRPFLHADIVEMDGSLDADLKASLGKVSSGDLNVTISPGHVVYRLDESRQVRVRCRGGKVEARFDQKAFTADIDLSVGQNGLNARVSVPRKALERDVKNAPLDGAVKLDARELGLVTAFFPSVTEKEGVLTADLRLSGLVGDPQLTGNANISIRGLDIPVAGIHVDETLLEIEAEKTRNIAIRGSLASGEDTIKVAGSVNLDEQKGWPARIKIKGSNFKIVDIPDAMVRISPDLKLAYSKKAGLNVSGLLVIPEAEITPQQIPTDVKKPSDDVVIVSSENPHGQDSSVPVQANVTIELKEKVHFEGFGLNCHVVGKLAVSVLPGKKPVGHGELRIKDGIFHIYGHDLEIQKGIISYAGGRLDNPGINLLAVRQVGGQPVGVRVTGYASALKISGYSTDPSISSEDALTMLITGKSKNDPGFEKAARNTAAIAGADLAAREFLSFTGLDHLDIKGSGENSSDTRVFAGEDVTERLTLGVEAGTGDDGTQFVAHYHLWKGLELEIKSGNEKSEMSLLYTIEIR